MLALQVGDRDRSTTSSTRPRDAGRKPGKPIPAGLVSPSARRASSSALARPSASRSRRRRAPTARGPGARRARRSASPTTSGSKGTAWSWLPFALGIPLLPVFGWLGAAGSLPASFAVLSRRRSSPAPASRSPTPWPTSSATARRVSRSVATRLGRDRAWLVIAASCCLVVLGSRARRRWSPGAREADRRCPRGRQPWSSSSAAGMLAGRRGPSARRERGWEVAGDRCRPCSRPAGWPRCAASGAAAARPARRAAALGRRLSACPGRVGQSAHHRDRVLEPSLAIVRYLARFARSTSAIEPHDVGRAQDADEVLDRVGELLLAR